ncbi:hypothetical protein GH714_026455 [Hevea brasiliensis]|uniref:Pentacotripeptide-repeat region of PRORP domain-containing protein n=1 Tax=Hevea brasiliensis TaxID=3981 RepID=A0A6A6M6S8_HEVBR|nr:hypothetical protein GH714_026455 [Hevea brasiliensis]
MWDAIRSMKQENVLSMATFASVFGSYCAAGRFNEAIMSFEVMDKYGIQQDVVAVNSLLSAMCREDNQTIRALEFFERIKSKIPPDGDTFAILLEGWEKEGNPAKARITFDEMVVRIGWSPSNNDYVNSVPLWDTMLDSGVVPNLIMYNRMISLLCNKSDIDNAFRHHSVMDGDDPEMAIEIWNYMVENHVLPLELDESANMLLIGLCNLGRLSEVRRFAEDMLDRKIKIYESTMSKLKTTFYKEGTSARDRFDSLSRRWRPS